MQFKRYAPVSIFCGEQETESVRLAVENLKRDLRRVLDCQLEEGVAESGKGKQGTPAGKPGSAVRILVGTLGSGEEICRKADLERIRDGEGQYHREAFLLQEKAGELLIVGSDRRGTIYGIYEFCENWLGVSPWYFFADVPVGTKQEVEIPAGYVKADWPDVEYRGIFINDEEELEHWVQRYMGEPTIGVRTYEKIFELLLRLKMNYIWPAMHVNSFNAVRENGALAHRMGIVVGTSHCDMLMRSNNREWYPWLRKKGYTDTVYDFSLPGRNREILKEYWRESIEQNRDFEVSYTLGMRGIHDSGFEVRALEGKTGRELLEAKIELLDSVIRTQEALLEENLGKETVKTFVPYKEVLELYDNGLEVPEDLTLIWVNDNYGYVRRYPGEKEKQRRGGNGLYYHNSYWAPPGGSYLFLCSIPLAHTRNELKKAYEEGIRKIWVTNFGAMKPLEQQMSFYAAFAWEAGREGALTEDEQAFLGQWIDRTFSGGYGAELAPLLTEYDQLTNTRKVEQMDADAFSQTAWGDEAAGRIHRYEKMYTTVNRIWKTLPREEQDAFFQLIGMKVHAAYYTNLMYYYADRSNLCMAQGKKKAAQRYTDLCREFDHARRSMLHYYNHVMSNGKWNGILTPEEYPPPRTAMHPACMPPVGDLQGTSCEAIHIPVETVDLAHSGLESPCKGEGNGWQLQQDGSQTLIVTTWNQGQEIVFTQPVVKWIEIGNEGAAPARCSLSGPEWIRFLDVSDSGREGQDAGNFGAGTSKVVCTVDVETRILFVPDREKVLAALKDGPVQAYSLLTGEIRITEPGGRPVGSVPVSVRLSPLSVEEAVTLWAGSREKAGAIPGAGYGQTRSYVGCIGIAGSVKEITRPDKASPGNCVEDDGRICAEASKGAVRGEGAGWKQIPNLGRDSGSLLEAREPGAEVSWQITVLTPGSHLLELHRFPSLDSVGTIQVGVVLDQEQEQVLTTASNDEHRGTWKDNIRNNVDKLYLRLPYMEAGIHRITFRAISRYFAFTRFVVYIGDRRENSLGRMDGDQHLPRVFDIRECVKAYYGQEAARLLPRPVLYLPADTRGSSLDAEDILVQPDAWGVPVKAEDLVKGGVDLPGEKEGRLLVECGAALANSSYAWMEHCQWQWCSGPSHGETGLAMYIRGAGQRWVDPGQAPALCYRVRLQGGDYVIWIRAMMWGDDTCHFTIGLDDVLVPEKALYGGKRIWRYSNEQVWKWIPVWKTALGAGEHTLRIVTFASGIRFEQIYITRGEELPPALESV